MPTIYQGHCASCGYGSAIFPAGYGAVFVDEPPAEPSSSLILGAVLIGPASGAEFAAQDDPRLVVLAHQGEQDILEETGYTWWGLAWSGRYVEARRVVSPSCGRIFDVRKLACPPGLGCMVGSALGLVAGVAAGIWEGSFCFGGAAGLAVVLVCNGLASLGASAYLRLRFRARALAGPNRCPGCGADKYVGVEGCRDSFPCPQCGERSMRMQSVGTS